MAVALFSVKMVLFFCDGGSKTPCKWRRNSVIYTFGYGNVTAWTEMLTLPCLESFEIRARLSARPRRCPGNISRSSDRSTAKDSPCSCGGTVQGSSF